MKQFFSKFSWVVMLFALTSNMLNAQSNQYLDFDGVDDFVTSNNASALIAGSSAISITGWFYDNALGYGQGMMGFRNTNAGFYLIQLNTGIVECRFQNSAGTLYDLPHHNNVVVPQTWQHFAWIYTGSYCKLYVGGNIVDSIAASGTITNTTTPFAIGKSILSGFNFIYNGRVDEVSVWNKALSRAEILDMMTNELTGTEPNLQLYYKFNQGVPGGNNTGISSLHTEVNSPAYDGTFNNFALNGATSNFNGTLQSSFQSISFPQIPPHLISDPPFVLLATATSGLPVNYMIVSGPGTISGDTLFLNGTAGTIVIQADQPGDATYDSAASVQISFDVVDPAQNLPQIDPRNPLAGNVHMPTLGTIQLAAKADIQYTPLFSVSSLSFVIDGTTTIPAHDNGNGHYTAWWTPASFGAHTIQISSASNFGYTGTETVNINVTSTTTDSLNVVAYNGLWLNSTTPTLLADANLPSFVGAYDTIIATLSVTCPTGGCDPWDRVASVDAQGHDGRWFEIIRYITPYGTPCSHSINLTDYMSILQGKVTFRANCSTLTNGYLYELKFDYKEGAPPHKYSNVDQVWKAIYPFGDYANLQPVPVYNYAYPSLAVASTLKLVSTGHGWGSLNTGNAAEFYDATHNILVNGTSTFTQHNWTICNPNPDACSPQNGTWTYSRAGWCPGSIAKYFDFNMTPYISTSNVSLQYQFQQSYIDQCHPNNPNCVTGVTCTDCNDGFNPTLDVNCNLITWYDDATALGVGELSHFMFGIYPNPSTGLFTMGAASIDKNYSVSVTDLLGNTVKHFTWNGQKTMLDLSGYAKGIYVVKVSDENNSEIRKLIVQ